jgi:hypothetical protein
MSIFCCLGEDGIVGGELVVPVLGYGGGYASSRGLDRGSPRKILELHCSRCSLVTGMGV